MPAKIPGNTPRWIRFPDVLWERIEAAAKAETKRTGYPVSPAELVRQTCAQKVDTILGKDGRK